MNYLEKLLQGAPVEWKTLGEVAEFIKTGKLNANAMEENGLYPFFTCNEEPYKINHYAFDMEAILISGNGSQVGHVNYYKGKFNAYQRTYVVGNFCHTVNVAYILNYFKYRLRKYINANSKKGSIPYITLPMLQNFPIPIPPLPVQKEIARILDRFTAITSELTSELTLRQKQYQHYRDQLLTFGDEVEWKTLGEVANFSQGIQVGVSDQFFEPREDLIRFLRIVDFVKLDEPPRYIKKPDNKYIKKYGDLIMIRYGASSAGKVFFNNSGAIANNTFKINIEHKALTNKFLFYYLSQPSIYSYLNNSSGKSTMPAITFNQVGSIKIPIPSIIEQQRIVSILDKFEMLTNSLSDGLPKEIELRQKQYAYYRDLLLGFENSTL